MNICFEITSSNKKKWFSITLSCSHKRKPTKAYRKIRRAQKEQGAGG